MKNYTILFAGLGILAIGATAAYVTNLFDIQNIIHTESQNTQNIDSEKEESTEKKNKTNIQFSLYFDFACPHCRDFYTNTYTPLLSEYSKKNVDFTILPYSQKTVGKSFILAKDLFCIQKINPNKTDLFIQNISITDNIKDNEVFEEKIKALKLSEKEQSDFFTCRKDEDKSTEKNVLKIREDARKKGVIGTPTFFINEQKFERNQNYIKVATELEHIIQEKNYNK